jgi:hypothetical protein
MHFKVVVADNFHYMDESEHYELGSFDSLELAIEASKRIVDEYLVSAYKPGMSAADLYHSYVSFGEDPFIVAADANRVLFSAWNYAHEQCNWMCQHGRETTGNESSDA